MEVFNTSFIYYSNNRNDQNIPTDLKLINTTNMGDVNFKLITGDNVIFHRHRTVSKLEYFLFFEISHKSPLWNFNFSIKPNNYYLYNHIFEIFFTIEPSLISEYLDKSIALNFLISTYYDRLDIFTKFDNNKSYILVMETYNDKKLPLYMINNLKKYINITDIKYTHGKFDNLVDYIKDTSSNKILFREQIKLPRILDYKNEKHQEYIKILID
jgi:hypothetical protein